MPFSSASWALGCGSRSRSKEPLVLAFLEGPVVVIVSEEPLRLCPTKTLFGGMLEIALLWMIDANRSGISRAANILLEVCFVRIDLNINYVKGLRSSKARE